jgi:TetR/AcrR family transcriptional repressor of nem operon
MESDMGKGEQTRQEIIRKAAPIFNQRGYDGAALSDLMKATGLEKGGIYRHFASKEQLAAEAFDFAWQEAWSARTRGLESVTNSVDRLQQLVVNFVERRGVVPGGCPLLNTAVDSDDGNFVLRQRVRKALQGWSNQVMTTIRAGIRKHEVRPGIDARKVATVIIATLEGAIMLSRLEKTDDALRTAQEYLNSYLEKEVRLQR